MCLCVCVCLWVCYHDNSKLRASILTQIGFVGKGSDRLQLIKFWPSRAPGKAVCGGAKMFGSALPQPAFASPPSAFCECFVEGVSNYTLCLTKRANFDKLYFRHARTSYDIFWQMASSQATVENDVPVQLSVVPPVLLTYLLLSCSDRSCLLGICITCGCRTRETSLSLTNIQTVSTLYVRADLSVD